MQTTVLPDDLAVMPPGAGLAAVLESIELEFVPNDRMLEVLRAQYRLQCHVQARTAAALAEVGRCAGFPAPGETRRLPTPERFAAEEIRAALCWTRHAAQTEHDLAEAVVHERPAVFAAWLAGDIDRPRVRVFDHYLTGLNQTQIASICQVAVPKAHNLTTGQLAVLLRRMVIAVDPDAAARWYREGIRRRGVVAYPAADGTITLSAHGLPADEAEAACTRLQNLAARAKRGGHPGLIDQIRADLYLGLLDGRFHHLTADQLVAALIEDYHAQESDRPDSDGARGADIPDSAAGYPTDGPAEASETRPSEALPSEALPSNEEDARPDSKAAASSSATPASAAPASAAPASAAPASAAPASATPDGPAPSGPAPEPGPAPGGPAPEPGRSQDQRVGIEIRIGLATLLGLDEHPAEIPGLGLLTAPDARRRVHLQGRSEWRFALTDAHGRLVFDGITRRRPHGTHRDGPPGGIVELHVPLSLLTELLAADTSTHPGWTDLIADIGARFASRDDQLRDLDARPDDRLPGAALRRHTEIRDRTCTFIGCRRRAHSTQQDHTHDHQHGGSTVRTNLGPLCPHDHQVKHLGGWRIEQPTAGNFIWHSPLGGTYRTAGETFLHAMPDPAPADPGLLDLADGPGPRLAHDEFDQPIEPILRLPAMARPPHRLPTRGTPDDPPPF